ncbi:MAG: hypothetical protein KF795_32140 [Labilithrix sp.]|nr:hypothetical protein [Labilithrix sp.]
MRIDAEVTQGRSPVRALLAAALAASLLALLALTGGAISTSGWVLVLAALLAVPFIGWTGEPRPSRSGRRRVGADARGLTVDGELVLPRQTILRAHVKDEPIGGHSVIVEARGLAPARIVRVDSPRIAQALADTLEQTPHDVVEFDALPPWAHRMRWLTIVLTTSPWILVNLLRHMPAWTILVVLALYGLIALPMVLPQKIAVGDDGILLRWAGRRRFVPFGLLREARATSLGVELELADDRELEIRLSHRADAAASRRAAMLERIDEGLVNHRALAPAEDEALLTRGDRDLDAWIREMNALGAADAHGYRTIAIPRERLWAVLENPGADPSARQGAALALRARLDEDERERLVTIAHKSASPRLRVSIDAVARAPDAPRLRVALEHSDDDDRRAPSRAERARQG